MRTVALITAVGVMLLLAGLYLAAALIWSPLAGTSVLFITSGAALTWLGLTYDVRK